MSLHLGDIMLEVESTPRP